MKETINKLTKHKTDFKKEEKNLTDKIAHTYGRGMIMGITIGLAIGATLILMGMETQLMLQS